MANWPGCCNWLNLSRKKASRKASLYIRQIQDFDYDERPTNAYTHLENIKDRGIGDKMNSNRSSNGDGGNEQVLGDAQQFAKDYNNYNGGNNSESIAEVVYRDKRSVNKDGGNRNYRSSVRDSAESGDNGSRSHYSSILKHKVGYYRRKIPLIYVYTNSS